MSKPIIEIQGIGKRYRIGANREKYLSLRDEIMKWLSPAARRARAALGEFWAIRDISFDVEAGETVGIIGRNGAGKSTLLKVLSKITPPTTGQIIRRGRVASLLEVGTGFHPELTGRENIYLNGAILGMTRREIAKKFDEIVAFSEVEKFLDTPVKRYSSGMYVRLAFAVAAHLEPEVLVVDEVLAVGDVEFQKKCLGKMSDVAKAGRTVLFVSHNMAAVRKLCSMAIMLSDGTKVMEGKTDEVIDHYLRLGASSICASVDLPPGAADLPGRGIRLGIMSVDGTPRTEFMLGERWRIVLEFDLTRPLRHVIASVGINTRESLPIVTYWSKPRDLEPGQYKAEFECDVPVKSMQLSICLGLSTNERTFYSCDNAACVNVSTVAMGEQPFRAVGAGLLLGNNDSEIVAIR
ncbi:MAG: polysaccharide ABC transporter ATP-binding protein [Armatimonadetes bacterium]|nr:polysaccharide ABC transporter ATP-binding protein [Armatimonadota bacterium]